MSNANSSNTWFNRRCAQLLHSAQRKYKQAVRYSQRTGKNFDAIVFYLDRIEQLQQWAIVPGRETPQ